jgi:hypothetical protein
VDPCTIARIVKARGRAAGFDPKALGGHSLKRDAMNTAKGRRLQPAQLKQLGRHRSYATLAAYIEEGDLFNDSAPLNGVMLVAPPALPCPRRVGALCSVACQLEYRRRHASPCRSGCGRFAERGRLLGPAFPRVPRWIRHATSRYGCSQHIPTRSIWRRRRPVGSSETAT